MLSTAILVNVKHTNDRNNVTSVDHFEGFICINISCDLILFERYPFEERHSFKALFNWIKFFSKLCHRFCVNSNRGVSRFCQVCNHGFNACHYFKLNILIQNFVLIFQKNFVGMSTINISMTAFIIELNSYFLQTVIIVHFLS